MTQRDDGHWRIERAHAIEVLGHQASRRIGQRDTNSESDGAVDKRALQHIAQDAGAVRAERHPHADLASAPLDGIRRDAVKADRSEDKRHQTEERGEPRQQLIFIEVCSYLCMRRCGSTAASGPD